MKSQWKQALARIAESARFTPLADDWRARRALAERLDGVPRGMSQRTLASVVAAGAVSAVSHRGLRMRPRA